MKNKIHIALLYLKRFLISLLPRDKHLIVYGGAWDLLIDNAKHQFILNNENISIYKHVWLSKKRQNVNYIRQHGFWAEMSNSLRGRFFLLRAGFVIFDDSISYFANSLLAVGAIRINIWHGIPVKMLGHSSKDEDYISCNSHDRWHIIRDACVMGDYCVCPSTNVIRYLSYSFQIPPEKIVIGNYPRNRFFFMSEEERENYVVKYESDEYYETYKYIKNLKVRKIVYMPTFRDKNKYYINEAISDWVFLNNACMQAGTVLFVKVHRVTPLPETSEFSNIIILDNDMDVYPMLPLFDMLITDYSSIMFDFSLLNKKILLYPYDMEQYRMQSRPLYNYYYDLLHELSSVYNFDDFVNSMSVDFESIKSFPSNKYVDKPNDFSGVQKLIEKLS